MVLACASTASADLIVQPAAPSAVAVPASPRDSGCDSQTADCGIAARTLSMEGLAGQRPWTDLPTAPAADRVEHAVRELPAVPSSASLFLSAMLSVGAWHAVRKAGHLHLASLPEWYHPDTPQIGRSVAFDPTLRFELLAVCPFDVPIGVEAVQSPVILRELPSRCESQCFLTIESPRGPPAIS